MRFITGTFLLLAAIAPTNASREPIEITSKECLANDVTCSANASTGAANNASSDNKRNSKTHAANPSNNSPHDTCTLYLAPSTIPHSILGLFSGTVIPQHENVNYYLSDSSNNPNEELEESQWSDLYIPLADVYKALPYRGQQRFPSWLSYVWPAERGLFYKEGEMGVFPNFPDEVKGYDDGLCHATGLEFYMDDYANDMEAEVGEHDEEARPNLLISALAPGLSSLANSHPSMHNIDRTYLDSRVDYEGMQAPWQPGAGAFTPHHGVEFHTTKGIRAGTELLLDYGKEWHQKMGDKLRGWQRRKKREEKLNKDETKSRNSPGFVEGIDRKFDVMDIHERFSCPEELPTEQGKRDRLSVGMAVDSSELKNGTKPYTSYRNNTPHPYDNVENHPNKEEVQIPNVNNADDITRSLPWLQENGVCLSSGKLSVGKSEIPYAGRGVFADISIKKDDVILTSPLLAMRKDDVKIYKSDPKQQFVRNVVDKTTIIGYEMLMNYAFSHEDSPMLLIPLAPIANFINHGGVMSTEDPDRKGANVQVRWPKDGGSAAKLFAWAYQHNQYEDEKFDENKAKDLTINPWLHDHPIDVMEKSGKLALEYVATRDIQKGEEVTIDYGPLWQEAWMDLARTSPYSRSGYFRHSIGVPEGFYPKSWVNVSDQYEIAEVDDLVNHRLVGKAVPLTWKHNGKPISSKYAYAIGLPKGFSDRFLEYSKENGIIDLYKNLLTEKEGFLLPSDGFAVYKPQSLVNGNDAASNNNSSDGMEFFAHRYHSDQWNFNMHFVSAWEEKARKSVLSALGDAGFDVAVQAVGERFGYQNLTCFHASYMGVTHCDKSKMHSDIYATDDKSWNIVFPLITVDGTSPELDVMAEDMNTVVGVHYLKDVAWAMGDFGYHQTRPIDYYNPADEKVGDNWKTAGGIPIRVVFGAYCAQIDETNIAMLRHVYDGDDPAPFADQFAEFPMREMHWDKLTGKATLANPIGD